VHIVYKGFNQHILLEINALNRKPRILQESHMSKVSVLFEVAGQRFLMTNTIINPMSH